MRKFIEQLKRDENLYSYNPAQCLVFFNAKQPYFELSNMATEYPIKFDGKVWNSSEALYQACKYANDLEVLPKSGNATIANVRERILKSKNAMAAKMTQKCAKNYIRPDWDEIKIEVMLLVLLLKYKQHIKVRMPLAYAKEEGLQIVERSSKDKFWGAVLDKESNMLVGKNMLGRLWTFIANHPNLYKEIDVEKELLKYHNFENKEKAKGLTNASAAD